MARTVPIKRMRHWATTYMLDTVRIVRDISDPDDWEVDEFGDLTIPEAPVIYEGPATIAANEQRYAEATIDRLHCRIPGFVEGVRRSDILEVVQSNKDQSLRESGRWVILDYDYGTHHITRRLECVSKFPKVERPPASYLEDR